MGDIGFSLSSSGIVIYKKDGTHATFCVKKDSLDAHITDERTGEKEPLFMIPLSSFEEWDIYQFILHLLDECSVTEEWVMNSGLLFQRFPDENKLLEFFEEFFEKKSGAYRLRDNVNIKLVEPNELEDGGYITYTKDIVLSGALIISKPWFIFIPIEEFESIVCSGTPIERW